MVFVCVCEREREIEREKQRVCVFFCEGYGMAGINLRCMSVRACVRM